MAIKIAIWNNKGGVGKTTTTINVADAFGFIGYRTLTIDMDEQRNATQSFDASEGEYTIVDVMKKTCDPHEAIVHTSLGDIIPGDSDFEEFGVALTKTGNYESILKDAMQPLEDEYDFIIIDCAPAKNPALYNSLCYANGVIVPMKPENYSLEGLGNVVNTINKAADEYNNDLKIYGVLLTNVNPRRNQDDIFSENLPLVGERIGVNVFKTAISIDQTFTNIQGLIKQIDENGEVSYIATKKAFNENGEKDYVEAKRYKTRSLYRSFGTQTGAHDYANFTKELLEVIANG